MMKIDCPFCGPRDEHEFKCGGQSHIQRPGPHTQVSDEDWAAYLHMRDNPRGWHFERWLHAGGCRQWMNLVRHTVTHDIAAVYAMNEPKPSITGEGQ